MDNREVEPAIEDTYEDPSPRHQAWYRREVFAVVAVLAIIFVIVLIAVWR
jgi:hypothetical protein